MRYPILFWDSGVTIFHFSDRPGGFSGSPSPTQVMRQRDFRVARALEMFGHAAPDDLAEILDGQKAELRERHGASFSHELLAAGLYAHLGITGRDQETLQVADALAGPRYRSWVWDGVPEALAQLHQAGVRMGIIADSELTGRMMRNALSGVGLVDFFGPILCSCDHGILKPDPRTFAHALSRLQPPPAGGESILYVGDNVVKDIDGATAFGWHAAHHLTTPEDVSSQAVLSFRDYADLVRLVLEG